MKSKLVDVALGLAPAVLPGGGTARPDRGERWSSGLVAPPSSARRLS